MCITYCVGGLKVANTTAEAFAEKSPVIIISGAPGLNERLKNPMLHHKVKTFETQQNVFNELCHSTVPLEDPKTAASDIDASIENALAINNQFILKFLEIWRGRLFLCKVG